MKKVAYIAFAIICLLNLPLSVQAQYYTGVLEVFYQSLAYPENFDQYVASNRSLFDSRFFTCLNFLEQNWTHQAKQEEAICNTHVNPDWKAKCFADAQFIPLVSWSANLRSVLAGQQEWPRTTRGGAAVLGKRLAGADLWVQSVNTVFQSEMHRRIYLCESTSTNPEVVSKAAWINNMVTILPTFFCHGDQYFRQCFNVSETECKETATSATRACLQKYNNEIPNTLINPNDTTYWGTIIGRCAGQTYEMTLLGRRISNTKCNDPTSWE